MKKGIWILLAAVLALGACGALLGTVLGSPSAIVLRAVSRMADDALSREEIAPLYDTLTSGSVGFSYAEKEEDDAQLAGTLYFSRDAVMLSDFRMLLDDGLLSGEAYISRKRVYVTEREILQGSYGVKCSDLVTELAHSVFAPDSGTAYAMEQEEYDRLLQTAEAWTEGEPFSEEARKLMRRVGKDVLSIVMKNATTSVVREAVSMDGRSFDARVITLSIDGEAMKSILVSLHQYLKEAEEVSAFLKKYGDGVAFLTAEGEGENLSPLAAYEAWLQGLGERVAADGGALAEDEKLVTVRLVTPRRQAKLLALEVERGGDSLFSLQCGAKGIGKSDTVMLDTLGGYTLRYHVSQKEPSSFAASLFLSAPKIGEVEASLVVNEGSYQVVCGVSYGEGEAADEYLFTDTYTIRGKQNREGDTVTVTVERIEKHSIDRKKDREVRYTIRPVCQLVVDTKDGMPTAKRKFTPLSQITEEQLRGWIEAWKRFD